MSVRAGMPANITQKGANTQTERALQQPTRSQGSPPTCERPLHPSDSSPLADPQRQLLPGLLATPRKATNSTPRLTMTLQGGLALGL